MTDPEAAPASPAPPLPDWESFYASYRKPGYVPGFEITHKLGGGAFGLVFRARKQSIGKDYAIKFLKVDDGEVRRAVLQELDQVRFFAEVDHPNLVAIEDRGEVDGIPFLVMGFAGAETLRDRLPAKDEGDRRELLGLFLQACRGVSALHDRSLVHFDLKPGNVFLKGNVARVGDYGLSRLLTHSRASLSMGRGTPYYMAPELLQRRGDWRSDVYSLGVMLFEILTGELPFRGENEWEVLKKQESEAPRIPAGLPAQQRAVLAKALHKDPAQRFQTVADLMAALGAPVSAGAAAWSDLAAGRAGAGTPPPAVEPDAEPTRRRLPPPLPSRDPYEKLRASAQQAMRQAAAVARDAASGAQSLLEKARERKAVQRARAQHRRARRMAERLRRQAERDARRAARGAGRRPSGVAAAFLTLGLITLVPLVMLARTDEPSAVATADSHADYRLLEAQRLRSLLPTAYQDLVRLSPPAWMGSPTRARAEQHLQRHLAEFGAKAPLSFAAITALPEPFPAFGGMVVLGPDEPDPVLALLEQVAGGVEDPQLEAGIRAAGRPALEFAAMQLEGESMLDEASVTRASRLHGLLRRLTGFEGIVLYEHGALADVVRQNRAVGHLWRWFLFEFARTDEAWARYTALRDG